MAKGEFIIMKKNSSTEGINVTRCKFDSLKLYEITEQEFTTIVSGSKNKSLVENAFFFLLSLLLSLTISLLTTTMTDMVKAIFIVGAIATFFALILLGCFGFNLRREESEIVEKIKSRTEQTEMVSTAPDSVQPKGYNEKK